VAQPFLDDLGAYLLLEQDGGRGVPEIVEPNVGEAEPLECRLEMLIADVLKVDGSAVDVLKMKPSSWKIPSA
jgi:hypothetical protein